MPCRAPKGGGGGGEGVSNFFNYSLTIEPCFHPLYPNSFPCIRILFPNGRIIRLEATSSPLSPMPNSTSLKLYVVPFSIFSRLRNMPSGSMGICSTSSTLEAELKPRNLASWGFFSSFFFFFSFAPSFPLPAFFYPFPRSSRITSNPGKKTKTSMPKCPRREFKQPSDGRRRRREGLALAVRRSRLEEQQRRRRPSRRRQSLNEVRGRSERSWNRKRKRKRR